MEHPIKKAGTLLPKFFRVFTLYIMLTLSVFFGYTKIFGNVAPVVIGLPTDDVDAEEETYFNSFVNSMMQFDSIDTDINLNLTTNDLNLTAFGNVVVTLDEDLSIEIKDLDLTFNDQHAYVCAVYQNSNLYLAINDFLDEEKVWYSFDLSNPSGVVSANAVEEVSTFKRIFDFVSQYLNLDMSFLDEFGQYIGIDFNNLDPTAIMSRLKIIEKEREGGGYYFNVSLGTAINAEITCDEDFRIETIVLNPINLKGNVLSFDANVSKMNSPEIVVEHDESAGGIDLSPITNYIDYAKALFENQIVKADLKFKFEAKEYDGTIFVNTDRNPSAKLVANVEGVDVLIGYQNENVYVEVADIKLKFDIKDFDEIKNTFETMLVKYTNKTAADFVEEVVSKYIGKDLSEINLEESMYDILRSGISSISQVNGFLPQTTDLTETTFEMLWQNGIKIKLSQEDELLKAFDADYLDYSLNAEFSVEQQGFDFEGEWFNISKGLPLSNIIDKILEKKQAGGTINLSRGQDSLAINYFVDFADGIVAQLEFEMFGEKLVVFANEHSAKIKIGEIVVECEYSDFECYLSRLQTIFGLEFDRTFDIDEAISFALSILSELRLVEEEDKIATISYLSNLGTIEVCEDKAKVNIFTDYFDAEIFAFSTENQIEVFETTDNAEDVLDKIENIYNLTKQKQFAVEFNLNVFDVELSGKAFVDLENQVYQVKDLEFAGLEIDFIYDAGTIYLKLGGDKVSIKAETALPLTRALSSILTENGIDLSSDFNEFDPIEFASSWIGRDISSLSLEEILQTLSLKLLGSLDQLKIDLNAIVFEETNAKINVVFENNHLSEISGVLSENVEFDFALAEFSVIDYDKNEYFNLIGAYSGTVSIDAFGFDKEIEIELDIREGVYLKAEIDMLGERAKVLLTDGNVYIEVGGIAVKSGLANVKEVIESASELFGLSLPDMPEVDTSVAGIQAMLQTLDLNAVDLSAIAGLTYLIGSEGIVVQYTANSIEIAGHLREVVQIDKESAPETYVEIDEILEKIERAKRLYEAKRYAFNFNVDYKGLELSGEARVDLENEEYSIQGLEIFGNELNATYRAGRVYLEYAGIKTTFSVNDATSLAEEIKRLVSGEVSATDSDAISELIDEIFGEDIREFDLDAWFEKASLRLLDQVLANKLEMIFAEIEIETQKAIGLEAYVEFSGNEINRIGLSLDELGLGVLLSLKEYEAIELTESEYLELINTYAGEIRARIDAIEYTANVELDLREGVYLKAEIEMLGERVKVKLTGGELCIEIGDIAIKSEVSRAKEILERFVSLPENNNAQTSILQLVSRLVENVGDIDLSSLSILNSAINYTFENDKMSASISLVAGATLEQEAEILGAVDFETDVLPKIENLKSLVENKIYEFDFEAEYNGFDFAGKLKIDQNNSIFEISDVVVCGEKVYMRLEDKKLYFAYGNMRYKFDVMQNQSANEFVLKDFLTKILGDAMPVEINFGRFENFLIDLRDKDIFELLEVLKLSLSGDINDLTTKLYRKGEILNTEILNANVRFEHDLLKSIDLSLFEGIIIAKLDLNDVQTSTISLLDEGDFENYSDDFVRGMLDSLAIESTNKTAYAFGGDIAIRYSNTDFYGDVVAMLVERETSQGEIEYIPAISISTSALNLSSYIYLIEDTIYLDIHGLQIQADLTQTTIDEVLDFVETNFDISLSSSEVLEATATALHVVLPAIDEIYGTWINGGIQINIGQNSGDDNFDRLTYGDDSWFYDMVAKVLVNVIESAETGAKTIVPTEVVFGANIHDPNTKVYDSYDEYLLKENDEVFETLDTKDLNFAVYLKDIEVGKYFEDTLNQTFVFDTENPTQVAEVKSNYGTTNLSNFNSYKILLDMFDSGYSYVSSLNYQGSVDASIQNGNNTTTIGADIVAKLDDLPEGATSAFTLYGNKYLKVQGNIDATMYEGSSKTTRHLLDILYESNDSAALYMTYSHDDYTNSKQRHIGKNSFKAKINNASLSGIFSILVDMLDINLGQMRENLSIEKSYIDFRFIQTLLNIGGTDVGDEISDVDQTLSSVEEILKLVRNINVSREEISDELFSTTLSVSVDWEDAIASLKLVWNEELSGDTKTNKLRQIKVENFAFGDSVINLTINLTDYSESSFNYDTTESHIDMSSISDFANVAINTLNTKEFNFSGSTSVSIIGISAISVNYDLYARIGTKKVVENGQTLNKPDVYLYLELSVTGSISDVTYFTLLGGGHTYTTDFGFDSRISTIVFENNILTITQKTHKDAVKGLFGTTLQAAKDKTLTWSYNSDQIGSNIMKIMAQAIGLTNSVYNIIDGLVENMNPYPSLEQTLLAFSKGTNQYTLKLDGTSLTGDSNFADMEIKLGLTTGYNIQFTDAQKAQYAGLADYERNVQFIDSIETTINIAGGTVKIPVKLNTKTESSGSYTTAGGRKIDVNNYYRNNYINEYKTYILNEFANGNIA